MTSISAPDGYLDRAVSMGLSLLKIEPLIVQLRDVAWKIRSGDGGAATIEEIANDLEQILNQSDLVEARALLQLRERVMALAKAYEGSSREFLRDDLYMELADIVSETNT